MSGLHIPGNYRPHPDPRREKLYFTLIRECLEAGEITREMLEAEMAKNHVRHDALEVVARVPPVDEVLGRVNATL